MCVFNKCGKTYCCSARYLKESSAHQTHINEKPNVLIACEAQIIYLCGCISLYSEKPSAAAIPTATNAPITPDMVEFGSIFSKPAAMINTANAPIKITISPTKKLYIAFITPKTCCIDYSPFITLQFALFLLKRAAKFESTAPLLKDKIKSAQIELRRCLAKLYPNLRRPRMCQRTPA